MHNDESNSYRNFLNHVKNDNDGYEKSSMWNNLIKDFDLEGLDKKEEKFYQVSVSLGDTDY